MSGVALYGCKGTDVFSFVLLSCVDMGLLSEDHSSGGTINLSLYVQAQWYLAGCMAAT